jgi:aspartate racemase
MQAAGQWDQAGETLAEAAQRLERGGADFLVLCTNTMHKVAPAIEARVSIPLLHIADATGEAIGAAGLLKVGLLGTRFTMEQAFYRERLEQRTGVRVLVPPEQDRARVHAVIYDELCLGEVRPGSRAAFQSIIGSLVAEGAEGIILGCTEICMLLTQADVPVPVFDTTAIHARVAVDRLLAPRDR